MSDISIISSLFKSKNFNNCILALNLCKSQNLNMSQMFFKYCCSIGVRYNRILVRNGVNSRYVDLGVEDYVYQVGDYNTITFTFFNSLLNQSTTGRSMGDTFNLEVGYYGDMGDFITHEQYIMKFPHSGREHTVKSFEQRTFFDMICSKLGLEGERDTLIEKYWEYTLNYYTNPTKKLTLEFPNNIIGGLINGEGYIEIQVNESTNFYGNYKNSKGDCVRVSVYENSDEIFNQLNMLKKSLNYTFKFTGNVHPIHSDNISPDDLNKMMEEIHKMEVPKMYTIILSGNDDYMLEKCFGTREELLAELNFLCRIQPLDEQDHLSNRGYTPE